MSAYRQYEPEPLDGEPAPWATVAQRRALIGRLIQWHERGWYRRREGVVHDAQGKNVLVGADWLWAPDMRNVHVLPEFLA